MSIEGALMYVTGEDGMQITNRIGNCANGANMDRTTRQIISAVTVLLLIAGWTERLGAAENDQLSVLDARATEGAAPGYVEDRVCARCHAQIYESYQHVGMAQSFRRASTAAPMEDFGREYYHEPSQRYYQILERDGGLIFRRYQHDKNGSDINDIEIPVAWVVGSGNRARSYLYQTDWGELYMLPLGWYSETESWGMSPGFEAANHPGISRRIQRECMFCHNAFPEVPEGTDAPFQMQIFPENLPEGTGCQRCHGPGADHINTLLGGGEITAIRDAIVNPGTLPADRRDSVCFQCHMLPSASVIGVRRFGRGVYSFRPGEKLSDYLVNVVAAEQDVADIDRFEINHHGYRLFQSSCYQKSQGKLGCISCHNPHVKPESSTFRESVSEVCTGCHNNLATLHGVDVELGDRACVTCHMPSRRTRDVINVTMTDHRIATGPFDFDALIRPFEKENPAITRIEIFPLGDTPFDNEAEAYRMIAAIRAGHSVNSAVERLEQVSQGGEYADSTHLIELATAQYTAGQYEAAEATARQIIEADDESHAAYNVLGISLMSQNLRSESVEMLKRSLELQPDPEAHFNLAVAYIRYNQLDLADEQLDAAIELRPYMAVGWKYKAQILLARGERHEARDALIRSLQLEPRDLSVYNALITLLLQMGDNNEAERYIELGTRTSRMLGQ